MGRRTMPDEYAQRYGKLTQQDLYTQLMAGSPTHVSAVAAAWTTVSDTIGALVTSLNTDLTTLGAGWHGPAATEFQRQIGLISSYAQKLVDEGAAISNGLTVMATTLQQQQQLAEAPQPPLPEPYAAFVATDPVLGTAAGYQQTADAQAAAQQRMSQVVAQLASDYAVTDHGSWPAQIPPPPPQLPGTVPPVTALAGAGPLAAATPVHSSLPVGGGGHVTNPSTAGPAAEPPATLGGATQASGASTRSVANSASTVPASGTPLTTGPVGGAGAGAMPMAGVTVPPRPLDPDYGTPADDGSGWSKAEEMVWHSPGEAPPSTLGPGKN